MSVTSTTNLIAANGNGSQTAFNFSFKIFAQTELLVYKATAAGVYTLQTLTTDYTVSFDTAAETGTVTYVVAPVSGGKSVIIRNTARTQASTLQREGPMPEKTIENALDKVTLAVQDIQERISRAALQPIVPASPAEVVIEAPVDGKGLRWDYNSSDGKWYIESTTYDPDEQQAAAAASAAAALASEVAAAASAVAAAASAATAVAESSGLLSARPAAPASVTWYWATDALMLSRYSPNAGQWFLVG